HANGQRSGNRQEARGCSTVHALRLPHGSGKCPIAKCAGPMGEQEPRHARDDTAVPAVFRGAPARSTGTCFANTSPDRSRLRNGGFTLLLRPGHRNTRRSDGGALRAMMKGLARTIGVVVAAALCGNCAHVDSSASLQAHAARDVAVTFQSGSITLAGTLFLPDG